MRKNLRRQAHQSKRLGHQRITYLLWLFLMPTTGMKVRYLFFAHILIDNFLW
ncbi:hypothetical protein Plhal304r1_c007g0027381 [Plasmopara halstedii]